MSRECSYRLSQLLDYQNPSIGQIYPAILLSVPAAASYGLNTAGVEGGNDLVDAPVDTTNLAVQRHTCLIGVGFNPAAFIASVTSRQLMTP
jgi:hypothetical protein